MRLHLTHAFPPRTVASMLDTWEICIMVACFLLGCLGIAYGVGRAAQAVADAAACAAGADARCRAARSTDV